MKKLIKVLLIIAACFAGMGVLLSIWGVAWSLRVVDRLTPEDALEQTRVIDAASLTALDVDTGVAELRFESASAQEARIEASGFSEGELTIEQKDGVLTIRSRDIIGGTSILNLGIFRIDWLGRLHTGTLMPRVITLYLPEVELKSFALGTGMGDVSGKLPFTAKTITISCGMGNVALSSLHASTLNLSQGVGEIILEDFSCDRLTFSGGTGNARLKNGSVAQSTKLSMGMGEITIDGGEWHSLDVDGGTGNFQFTGSLRGTCSFDAGTGDITLSFDDAAENYSILLHKSVGSIHANGAQLTVTGDGEDYSINPELETKNTLEIDMGVGNITLTFPE